MIDAAKRTGATILPVDSEHNAIFQCLAGNSRDGVAKLILTASGGPFRSWTKAEMDVAGPEQALKHPNWSMGAKISIDSATMMNKGLELIEAHHLFGLPSERIDILVHPQSVIHSMVEYVDGSTIAQLGSPDMRIPIAHCLAYPDRIETRAEPLDLIKIASLTFEAPDPDTLSRRSGWRAPRSKAGRGEAIVLNAANELAVAAFLDRRIAFGAIADDGRARHRPEPTPRRHVDRRCHRHRPGGAPLGRRHRSKRPPPDARATARLVHGARLPSRRSAR